MKKSLATIVVGAVLVMAAPAAMRVAEGTDAVALLASGATFELTYRGLTVPDDPLSYRSYWGFGQEESDTPFLAAVKKRVKQYDLVVNTQLPKAMQWSLVELQDGKPVALYFDADANGEFSDNERFPHVPPQRPRFGYECAFITSDFMIPTADRKEAPFRIMLVGYRNGPKDVSYMWSPCCVLEGRATLDGQPTKLILYASGFDGAFSTFRAASFALVPADQKIEGYVAQESLSSLICYKDTFYRLKVAGAHEKDKTIRVTLEKDTTPTGTLGVELAGREALKGRLMSAMIAGTKDEAIYFRVGEGRTTLPAGAYRLASGYVSYGVESDDEWRVDFRDGPGVAVAAAETSAVKMGELTLSVDAVAEKDRYRSDVKATSTFPKGTVISISPQIKGKAGETYMRFTRQGSSPSAGVVSRVVSWVRGTRGFADVKPHLTITDPDGNKIVSKDLEYG